MNNLYYLKPTAGFHRGHSETHTRHKTPSRKTQAALPPAPTAKSTALLSVTAHPAHDRRRAAACSARRTGECSSGVQTDKAWRILVLMFSSRPQLPDTQAGGSRAARLAPILLAADEHAAWSCREGRYQRMCSKKLSLVHFVIRDLAETLGPALL